MPCFGCAPQKASARDISPRNRVGCWGPTGGVPVTRCHPWRDLRDYKRAPACRFLHSCSLPSLFAPPPGDNAELTRQVWAPQSWTSQAERTERKKSLFCSGCPRAVPLQQQEADSASPEPSFLHSQAAKGFFPGQLDMHPGLHPSRLF